MAVAVIAEVRTITIITTAAAIKDHQCNDQNHVITTDIHQDHIHDSDCELSHDEHKRPPSRSMSRSHSHREHSRSHSYHHPGSRRDSRRDSGLKFDNKSPQIVARL